MYIFSANIGITNEILRMYQIQFVLTELGYVNFEDLLKEYFYYFKKFKLYK